MPTKTKVATEEQPQREVLFTSNGVDYYLPEKLSPNIGFAFLRDLRAANEVYALSGVIAKALGPEALDALAEDETLTAEETKRIMGRVYEKVVPVIQLVQGNS